MLLGFIPLIAISAADDVASSKLDTSRGGTASSESATRSGDAGIHERSAQVRLADMLGSADSIDEVRAHGHTFTFLIERADASGYEAPYEIVATTGRAGNVVDVDEHARVASDMDLGALSWLADTMQETVAITRLDVDEDGAVTLESSDGQRYMAIPGRGSGGAGSNEDVDARWAAEFDQEPNS